MKAALKTPPLPDGASQAAGRDAARSLRLWLQLMKASKAIEGVVAGNLRRSHGQSLARFDVLSQLYRSDPDWLAIGELAGRMMATSGNITGLLDRMAAEDLIERRASPTDRRSHQVRMTDAGRELFHGMVGDHAAWVDAALADVSAAEKDQLTELLIRVRRAFEGGADTTTEEDDT